jgi:peptidoglycan hydrolase-like protein with peptidoglycan-binding domain
MQQAPAAPQPPQPSASSPQPAQAAQPPQAADKVAEAQGILAGVAGIPLERFGADGRIGPETRQAVIVFQKAAQLPVTGELDDLTINRLHQLRDGKLPPQMESAIRVALQRR